MKVHKHRTVLQFTSKACQTPRTLLTHLSCVSLHSKSEHDGVTKLKSEENVSWESSSLNRADCLRQTTQNTDVSMSPIIDDCRMKDDHKEEADEPRVLASSISSIKSDIYESKERKSSNMRSSKEVNPLRRYLKSVKELSKFNLSCFNAMVTGSTAFVSSGGLLYSVTIPATLGCMGLATAASALNQWQESEFDSRMHRTRLKRPLCNGRLTQNQALLFVVAASASGTGILAWQCGSAAAMIGLATMISYNAMYTPLKRITPWNTEFGAVVGALPPQIGIAASHFVQNPNFSMLQVLAATVTDPLCWFSLSLLFAWQMPHFLYISVRNREDYIRGGFKMWSHSLYDDSLNSLCRRKSLVWSMTLPLLPAMLSFSGATSWMFALDGGVLSMAYVASVRRWQKDKNGHRSGRQSFMFNLIYLPSILALMAIHSQRWKYDRGHVIQTHMAWIQDKGISLCPWDNSEIKPSELPTEPVACTSPFRPELKQFHSDSRKMYKVDSDGTVTQTRISS